MHTASPSSMRKVRKERRQKGLWLLEASRSLAGSKGNLAGEGRCGKEGSYSSMVKV